VIALVTAHIAQRQDPHDSILLDTVMSLDTNENIVEQFAHLATTTSGMKRLEQAGQMSVAHGLMIDPGALGDFIAGVVNVPRQATYAMTGLFASALFGILKRHLFDNHAALPQGLDKMLAEQWPALDVHVTNPLAQFLHFANAAALRRTVNDWLNDWLRRQQAEESEQHGASPANVMASGEVKNEAPGQPGHMAASVPPSAHEKALPLPAHRSRRTVAGVIVLGASVVAVAGVAGWLLVSSLPFTSTSTSTSTSTLLPLTSAPPPARTSAASVADGWARSASGAIQPEEASAASATAASGAAAAPALASAASATSAGARAATDEGSKPKMASLPPRKHSGPSVNSKAGAASITARAAAAAASSATKAAALATDVHPALTASQKSGSCLNIGHVLNLQSITFDRDSASVPASATGNLHASAKLLRTCAENHQPVRLDIEAFSDAADSAQAGSGLPARRAEAVREFLVQAGVPAESLTAHGFDTPQPAAGEAGNHEHAARRHVMFAVVARGGA
jgi:outer membrane protein OmpA-like peptidoglycan-associated protein